MTSQSNKPSANNGRLAHKNPHQAKKRLTLTISLIALISAILLAMTPVAITLYNQHIATQETKSLTWQQSRTDKAKADKLIADAKRYNETLTHQPQLIGESADPFSGNPKGDFAFHDDKTYWNTLNTDDRGLIGSIEIPSIGVNLPIDHGSDASALDNGIGHLHGTSLPVGGEGTNSVLTGHRGLNDKLLFARLNELKTGDVFYIHVLNQTYAYSVDNTATVEPTDMSLMRIKPNEDRVTLVTCTPYGVNTQRLVVSASRGAMPGQIPYPQEAPKDTHMLFIVCAISLILALLLLALFIHVLKPRKRKH